ncbi:hypothetical protein EVA_21463 [gut metagenome]|uniref:Uncharacterized protein n=1 Tax=gut metagenome TaxID=749906 RepID=J9BS75_9ZZZZ
MASACRPEKTCVFSLRQRLTFTRRGQGLFATFVVPCKRTGMLHTTCTKTKAVC